MINITVNKKGDLKFCLTCDACNKEIEYIEQGIIIFNNISSGNLTDYKITHKGECSVEFDWKDKYRSSIELEWFKHQFSHFIHKR